MLSVEEQTAVMVPTMPFRQLKIVDYIDQAKKRKLFKGEHIIGAANSIEDLYYYYVEKGQLRCSFTKINGEPATLFYRNKGNAFSIEYGGIASVGEYKMHWIATTDTVVFGFTQQQLYNIMLSDPDVFYEFILVCHMAFGQLGHRITSIGVQSAMKRLVFWLQKLCAQREPDAQGVYTVPVVITNQQLAELLNLHVTTCSRLVSTLEVEGLIRRTRNEITIFDLARLSELEGE
jgi:CRP/FNR family cyclic AMP-dependent transcriptional regulator